MDQLLPHKEALETQLKNRLGELFGREYDLLLYDVTSTYFEGQAERNPLAQRGYSRDQRSDCKQVLIALVVSRCGMPLGYELFAGNTADVTTVEEIVTTMETRYGQSDRIWVMDRGMVSEANLRFLSDGRRRYIVGTPKSMLRKFERQLLTKEWHAIREDLEVKFVTPDDGDEDDGDDSCHDSQLTCRTHSPPGEQDILLSPDKSHEAAAEQPPAGSSFPGPEAAETFILCRSQDRRQKEEAILKRFEEKIEGRLKAMADRCQKQNREPQKVEREVGRLLGQNTRAAKLFEVKVEATSEGQARIQWKKIADRRDWATTSAGCYLLRTNVRDWRDEDLWKAYMQLTEAEAAFRIQKSDLSLRPIWHQKENRVRAHILVCFLAYVLWKTLGQLCQTAGLGNEPRRVFDELGDIQVMDVVLPTRAGQEIRQRRISRPTDHQQILLDHQRLKLLNKIKPIEM